MDLAKELAHHAYNNRDEIKKIEYLLSKDDIVLDVGACVGYHTLIFSRLAKKVYAFEPSPYNFALLEENMKDMTNVILFNFACSDMVGFADLYITKEEEERGINSGMNRLYESQWWNTQEKTAVKTIALDTWPALKDEKITFVKIDVEGWELQVLRGLADIVEKYRPKILLEFHPPTLEEAGTNAEAVYTFLKDKGYRIAHFTTGEEIKTYGRLDSLTRESVAVNILCV